MKPGYLTGAASTGDLVISNNRDGCQHGEDALFQTIISGKITTSVPLRAVSLASYCVACRAVDRTYDLIS